MLARVERAFVRHFSSSSAAAGPWKSEGSRERNENADMNQFGGFHGDLNKMGEFDFLKLMLQGPPKMTDYASIRTGAVPDHLKDDPSWPNIRGTDEFIDLLNIPKQEFTAEQRHMVNKRALERMGHTPFEKIELPMMKVDIPEDHVKYQALSSMKLSLLQNPYLKMEEKDELMAGIIEQVDEALADTEPVFLGFKDD